jgi:hypothetical protein
MLVKLIGSDDCFGVWLIIVSMFVLKSGCKRPLVKTIIATIRIIVIVNTIDAFLLLLAVLTIAKLIEHQVLKIHHY